MRSAPAVLPITIPPQLARCCSSPAHLLLSRRVVQVDIERLKVKQSTGAFPQKCTFKIGLGDNSRTVSGTHKWSDDEIDWCWNKSNYWRTFTRNIKRTRPCATDMQSSLIAIFARMFVRVGGTTAAESIPECTFEYVAGLDDPTAEIVDAFMQTATVATAVAAATVPVVGGGGEGGRGPPSDGPSAQTAPSSSGSTPVVRAVVATPAPNIVLTEAQKQQIASNMAAAKERRRRVLARRLPEAAAAAAAPSITGMPIETAKQFLKEKRMPDKCEWEILCDSKGQHCMSAGSKNGSTLLALVNLMKTCERLAPPADRPEIELAFLRPVKDNRGEQEHEQVLSTTPCELQNRLHKKNVARGIGSDAKNTAIMAADANANKKASDVYHFGRNEEGFGVETEVSTAKLNRLAIQAGLAEYDDPLDKDVDGIKRGFDYLKSLRSGEERWFAHYLHVVYGFYTAEEWESLRVPTPDPALHDDVKRCAYERATKLFTKANQLRADGQITRNFFKQPLSPMLAAAPATEEQTIRREFGVSAEDATTIVHKRRDRRTLKCAEGCLHKERFEKGRSGMKASTWFGHNSETSKGEYHESRNPFGVRLNKRRCMRGVYLRAYAYLEKKTGVHATQSQLFNPSADFFARTTQRTQHGASPHHRPSPGRPPAWREPGGRIQLRSANSTLAH